MPITQDLPLDQTTAVVSKPSSSLALDVGGMKCAGCVRAVEQQLKTHPAVVSATVNLLTEAAVVEYLPGQATGEELAQKLTQVGFPTQVRWNSAADVEAADTIDPVATQQLKTRQSFRQVAIAATLLVLSTIGHLKHVGWTIPLLSSIGFHWVLATLALLFPGRPILTNGWQGLRHGAPNMNTLVSLGTLTAYLTSVVALLIPSLGWECFFDEPVMMMGFILLGRALEQQAKGRATAAFQSLLALQPALARLVMSPHSPPVSATVPYVEIPASRVKVGEWLQILPGDKFPVDGEVVIGQTTVDESSLTGESVPVIKQAGDAVVAGSVNRSGAIVIHATRTGNDTTLSQIIQLVETAQTRKAPIQRLADTIAGYFTYGVMAIALLTFLFWYFIGIRHWLDPMAIVMGTHALHAPMTPASSLTPSALLISLRLAIAVLVVACPCALGLATPTALLVGSSLGAEQGILIRGGDVLETVHRLTTIVFDKTGTLTAGQPTLTDYCSLVPDLAPATLLQLAASVEQGTQHPLAEAIRNRAFEENLPLLPVDKAHTEPGYGVSAYVGDKQLVLGTQDWLTRQRSPFTQPHPPKVHQWAIAGKTLIYVALDGILVGLMAAQDTLRPDAKATVTQLQQQGLRVMMVTGDHPIAAQFIAQSLGISPDDVLADVRPEGKVSAIAQLQSQENCVCMVGDGINDAPALVQADVGMALQSATDVALETAEIVLMRNRLIDVVESIRLSQATFTKIQQNLFWAFAYNLLCIPAAAGLLLPIGLSLSPAIAGALMAFSSITVVINSLALRRYQRLNLGSSTI
ncbi:MAG: copper-translocating P-type ATPase [Leptolyngbyaceae cyanobacterium SL_7_1]|nr:copper-translocating P-type ATPase [Leptolyngbyaceae cyanobacterium SL_7_1]